jgi:hypothetical protein
MCIELGPWEEKLRTLTNEMEPPVFLGTGTGERSKPEE